MASSGIVEIVAGRNDRREHVFSVLVKRTYRIKANHTLERAESDEALRKVDAYYDGGDPEWSTVQYESEVAPYKPLTDVVVIGKAYAPRGVPTLRMQVGVDVGDRKKVLTITGNRQCNYREGGLPVFTDPKPFVEMDLRYERAYGGIDERSMPTTPLMYPRNPRGTGVVLRNVKEVVEGLQLPNIEDPRDLIAPERLLIGEPEHWHLQPLPQGFGWLQRDWYPRSIWLGSCPPYVDPGTITTEERMGLVPNDHVALTKQSRLSLSEARFANGASFGMVFSDLRGDERVSLGGLTPDGGVTFSLPGETPRIGLDLGAGMQQLEVQLHTVSIRPEDAQADLIWRGAQTYEGYGWLPKMTRLQAEVL